MKNWRLVLFLSLLSAFLGCELEETSYIRPIPKAAPATDVSTTSFTAHWHSMLGVDKYRIDVSANPDFNPPLDGYGPKELSDTFAIIDGLTVNTTYYYRVSFESNKSVSDVSEKITVKTGVFASPIALPAIDINEVSLTAAWKPVEGAESYSIDFSTNPAFDKRSTTTETLETKDTVYVFSDLEVSRTYYYRVRSRSGNTISNFSKIISAQTTNLNKPVAKEATEITLTSFRANWNAVDGAKKYLIDVSTDATFSSVLEEYSGKEIEALSENISGLDANKDYFFRIRALNNDISSEYSDVIAVKTAPLEIPVAIEATDHTHRSFIANWNPSESAQSYLVSVYTDAALTVPVANYIDIETVEDSLQIYDLQPSKEYYYVIKAKGLNAISAPSNTITTQTATIPVPILKPSEDINEFGFTCHWEGIEGVNQYLVQISNNSKFTTLLREKQVDGLSTTLTGLAPAKTYFIRVRAQNGGTSSAFSNTESTVTKKIEIPVATLPTAGGTFKFTANWESVNIAETYEIELATEAEFNNIIRKKEVNVNYIVFEGLQPGLDYFYRVKTKVNGFGSDFSNVVSTSTGSVSIPNAVDASNIGLFGFTANWSAVEGTDNYIIQIAKDATFGQILVQESVDQTYYQATNLDPNTKYFYRLRTVINNFPSNFSNTISATTLSMQTPIAADATNVDLFNFTANWSTVEGADNYIIQISKDNTFKTFDIQESVSQTYYETTGLTPNTTYYYRVKTMKNNYSSAFSSVQSVNTTNIQVPSLDTASKVSLFGFTASWSTVANADGYDFELATDAGFTSIVNKKTVNQVFIDLQNLKPSTKYFCRVRTIVGNFTSDFSTSIEVTTQELATPVALAATNLSNFGFRANWQTVTNAQEYEVEVAEDKAFSVIVTKQNTSEIFFDFNKLEPGKNYYYRIRSLHTGFASAFSSIISLSTVSIPAPVASVPTKVDNFSFTAEWSAVIGAESYDVELATDASFGNIISVKNVTNNYYEFVGLSPQTTYYFRVKTIEGIYGSAYSNSISVSTLAIEVPVALAASAIDIFSFTANWQTVSAASGYVVELSTDAGFSSVQSSVSSSSTYHTFTDLKPNTDYYYRVKSEISGFTSAPSSIVNCKLLPIPVPTAHEEEDKHAFGFTAKWDFVAEATSYSFDLATDPGFTQLVSGYSDKSLSDNFLVIDKLDYKTTYYYRVRAKRLNDYSDYSSTIVAEPAVANCKLTQIKERWSKSLYNIEFTYDADGRVSEFFIDRNNTADDVSFKVYYEDNMIKNIDKYSGVDFSSVTERWWPTRDADNGNRISTWSVRSKGWGLVTLKDILYKEDGRIDRIQDYSDWSRTTLTADRPYEYYGNGEVNVIYRGGAKEIRYEYDKNALNPLNLLDPELSIVIETFRGTTQVTPSLYCPGFEYWADGDPNRLGFYYDVNNLKLPTFKYTTRTITFKYNAECPIE